MPIPERYHKELHEWSDVDVITELTERYEPTQIPPCTVCGGELTVGKEGGGEPTEWLCSPYEDDPEQEGRLRIKQGRALADSHAERSRFVDYRRGGDRHVMEAIRRWLGGAADATVCERCGRAAAETPYSDGGGDRTDPPGRWCEDCERARRERRGGGDA